MKLYVGNLPWKIDNRSLKDLFSSYGEVEDAVVIKNKFNGRSKGFGFVTFVNDADGQKAMSEMNEKEVEGRALTVNEAKPMNNDKNFSRNDRNSFKRDNDSREAPKANSDEINSAVEDSIEEESEPEVVDDDSDAEEGEEDFDDADDAVEDSKDDEPAVDKALPAEETNESDDDDSEDDLDFDDEED